MSSVINAVIAAAGTGSRLGMGMPKAMIEVGEKSLLSRMLEMMEKHVENIHVVSGYREEMIIDECARHHPHVIVVRNPDFRSTNTAYSYALGAAHLQGTTIFIDGDLLVEPDSMKNFIDCAATTDILLGITRSKSDNAVFVATSQDRAGLKVDCFSRENRYEYEWANVVAGPANLMEGATGFVFEHLTPKLSCRAQELDLAEVDTADDLARIREFAAHRGL